MAKRDFNVKKFLLEYGERLGFGVAAVTGSALLGWGLLMAATSESSDKNVKKLQDLVQSKRSLMDNANPDPSLGKVDQATLAQGHGGPIDGSSYALAALPIDAKMSEDARRRGPNILGPVEVQAATVLARFRSIRLNETKDQVYVLPGNGRDQMSQFQQTQQAGSAGRGRGSGEGGGGEGGSPSPAGTGTQIKNTGAWVKIEDLAKLTEKQQLRLAERVNPKRLVMVVGVVPFRQQIEEFQRKLRYNSIDELYADAASWPQFRRMAVQRRTVGSEGPDKDWQVIDIKEQMLNLLVDTLKRVEPDDEIVRALSVPGLMMPRPLQHETGKYPKLELEMEKIKQMLTAMKERDRLSVPNRPRIDNREDLDPFNPSGQGSGSMTPAPGTGTPPTPAPPPGLQPPPGTPGTPTVPTAPPVPDFAVLRFFDSEVEPGKTYEYRLQLTMTNPNYKRPNVAWRDLAVREEIQSDWFDLPLRVTVPSEIHVYAVNDPPSPLEAGFSELVTKREPTPEQITVQVHRWIESFAPNPDKQNEKHYVGDWSIGRKMVVGRGESLVHTLNTLVPIYDQQTEAFILAPNPTNKFSKPIVPIRYGPKLGEMILVDFTKGKVPYTRPGGGPDDATVPTEVLILNADGSLSLRDWEKDKNDKERIDRMKATDDRILSVLKLKGTTSATPGGGS